MRYRVRQALLKTRKRAGLALLPTGPAAHRNQRSPRDGGFEG